VAVGDFGFVEEFVERGSHDDSMLPLSISERGVAGGILLAWPIVSSQRRSGGRRA
jgi:hypothetical protein